jgi:hypothetical protein
MNNISVQLNQLFERIPRRHSSDNVKEIYNILDEYEDMLREIETEPAYEKDIAQFFDELEPIRAIVKKSNDNKANKKTKDNLFDEASGNLKDTMEALKQFYTLS